MIKHIVFWKLFDDEDGFNKQKSVETFLNELNKLPDEIEVIKSFSAGANLIESKDAADIVLEVTFENLNDLAHYQQHPAHLAFIGKIKNLRYERRVIDYDLNQ